MLGANFNVTWALAPAARFKIGGGTDTRPDPSRVVPDAATCRELMVTFPLLVMVTVATKFPLVPFVSGCCGEPLMSNEAGTSLVTNALDP